MRPVLIRAGATFVSGVALVVFGFVLMVSSVVGLVMRKR